MKKIALVSTLVLVFSAGGCASIAKGVLRSALGINKSDEDDFARRRNKERKQREERKWIQYWRDHPKENPAMTEAFKDDSR